ncbi:MAG: hypothetical protein ACLSX0_01025 [Anaerostipes caccae]|jgi:uncharacterized membrane protein
MLINLHGVFTWAIYISLFLLITKVGLYYFAKNSDLANMYFFILKGFAYLMLAIVIYFTTREELSIKDVSGIITIFTFVLSCFEAADNFGSAVNCYLSPVNRR